MSSLIEHTGVVISVSGNSACVKFIQSSACAACQAKSMCMSTDQKERIVNVTFTEQEPLQIGDNVKVTVTQKMGWKAVLLAYVMPFAVLIAVVSVLDLCIESEAIAGTIALCATGVYYIILSFFKDRLQKEFTFSASKVTEEDTL